VNQKNKAEISFQYLHTSKPNSTVLPSLRGTNFLIGESTNIHTQTDAWRTALNCLFPKSEFPSFHPHRFRHTWVVEWLAAGLTLEGISGMIGTSVKKMRARLREGHVLWAALEHP